MVAALHLGIGGRPRQPLRGDLLEQPDRIVTGFAPEGLVEPAKEVAGLGVPGPPEVLGQLGESFEGAGHRLHSAKECHSLALRR